MGGFFAVKGEDGALWGGGFPQYVPFSCPRRELYTRHFYFAVAGRFFQDGQATFKAVDNPKHALPPERNAKARAVGDERNAASFVGTVNGGAAGFQAVCNQRMWVAKAVARAHANDRHLRRHGV